MSALEDINQGKGYILGVLAFATAAGAFLTQVVNLRTEPTLIAVAGVALTILFIGWLVQRSENHQSESMGMIECCKKDLEYLRTMAVENQRASLRIEMNDLIARDPANHDRILQYAERYFITYEGDWTQTDAFLAWVDKENALGRKVHVPPALLNNVSAKKFLEKQGS